MSLRPASRTREAPAAYQEDIDHVGIYLGWGVFAHASSYGSRVVIESLEAPHNQRAYRGARRPLLEASR